MTNYKNVLNSKSEPKKFSLLCTCVRGRGGGHFFCFRNAEANNTLWLVALKTTKITIKAPLYISENRRWKSGMLGGRIESVYYV